MMSRGSAGRVSAIRSPARKPTKAAVLRPTCARDNRYYRTLADPDYRTLDDPDYRGSKASRRRAKNPSAPSDYFLHVFGTLSTPDNQGRRGFDNQGRRGFDNTDYRRRR